MSTAAFDYKPSDQKLALKMLGLIGAGGAVIGVVAAFFFVFVWKTSVGHGYADFDVTVPKTPVQQAKKAFYCNPGYPTKWIGCQ